MNTRSQTRNSPEAAPEMVTIEVDGKTIQAPKGSMLIQATDAAGIYVPRFCYHKHLSIAANCRMCLVDVEKAPKPLPACATPVVEGMKVFTRSPRARDAQKGTMEFLLINHPLDCPICDQGGECQLQDLAVGYGKDASRYHEAKRIVKDKNLGPLIATDMTRCIHCTRCVRFGQELAGIMELGATGRGEHMQIGTYIERSVDSELSGNVIDLCPVGALTSKPFRYQARPWELTSRASVSPHDCVGTNLYVQSRRGTVLRVLPRENPAINWTWLADRDRFSYEAVNSPERLLVPMIRRAHGWEETDWQTALEHTVGRLKAIAAADGAEQIGALAAPGSTLEEFYLLAKLMRAIGSGNVDHRLRQGDFSDDANVPVFPWLGQSLEQLERQQSVLLIGSNPRKDQPLINLRLRRSALRGGQIMAINPQRYDFNYPTSASIVTDPLDMVRALAGVAVGVSRLTKAELPSEVQVIAGKAVSSAVEQVIAETLVKSESTAILLGTFALSHPHAARLRALAQLVSDMCSARLGVLANANSAGGWLAGCVPHRGVAGADAKSGRNVAQMLREPLKAYVLLGAEPELDCLNGARAHAAMEAAEFVVMLTPFRPSMTRSRSIVYADVLLPIAPFTETAGTFVNCEGRHQSFEAAVAPPGQVRPGWKILRVLGSLMGAPGFEQTSIEDVRGEVATAGVTPAARLKTWQLPPASAAMLATAPGQFTCISEVPIYAVDALTRRAPALQATADNPPPAARINGQDAARAGLRDGETVVVRMAEGAAELELRVDDRVPAGCVVVPAGHPETAGLGGHGTASLARAGQ